MYICIILYCIVGKFREVESLQVCDLTEFAKFSLSEMFSTKRYKDDFEQKHEIFLLYAPPYMSTHNTYVCA